jgi:hypothetical protein
LDRLLVYRTFGAGKGMLHISILVNIFSKSKSIVLKCGEKQKSTELIHDVERVWQELLYANVPPFYRDAPHNGLK